MLQGLMEVILYAEDMAAQVAFYRDVLGLTLKYPTDVDNFSQVYWVELETGACTLVLHGGGQKRIGEDAPKFVFRVDDVDSVRQTLIQRGVKVGDVRSPAPGVVVCDGVDPEGNAFSIETK